MNLVRGLWRLAVVAGLLWVAVVGTLHWAELREDLAVVQSRLELEWQRDDAVPTLDTPLGRFTPSGELAEFLAGVQKLSRAEAERRLAMRYRGAVERLQGNLLLLFGPPLALIVVLVALGWVARGFRA